MKCPYCGNENGDDLLFCPSCGEKLREYGPPDLSGLYMEGQQAGHPDDEGHTPEKSMKAGTAVFILCAVVLCAAALLFWKPGFLLRKDMPSEDGSRPEPVTAEENRTTGTEEAAPVTESGGSEREVPATENRDSEKEVPATERTPETETPQTEAPLPETEYTVTESDVRLVQQLLAELGYDYVAVDGKAGPKTKMAISDFREKEGLPSGDHIDRELIDALETSVSRSQAAETFVPDFAGGDSQAFEDFWRYAQGEFSKEFVLQAGEKVQPQASIWNGEIEVNNPQIVSVDNEGVITALSPGTTKVVYHGSGDMKETYTVVVK